MAGRHMEAKNVKGRPEPAGAKSSRAEKNDGYCAVGEGEADGGFDSLSPGFGRLLFFN
jgi:hypothetical protein